MGFRAVFAALLIAGCSTVSTAPRSFEASQWQVRSINGQSTPAADNYRMEFREGRASGRFGCNQFGGAYQLSGNVIAFGSVAATRMACPDPAMSFEAQGLKVLQLPVALNWASANRLELSNSAGSIALERLP